jgi:vitamin B12 transporter
VRTMRALALGVAMLAAPIAEAEHSQEPRRLDPVVVTATKVETPQAQLGASVNVITEEDLRTWNHDLHEALRQVPGVEVQRSGGLGRTTSIRIRGASANQVVVLVDGMRVTSPTLGTTELSDLSLDAIERIEVIRGPQSGLYGADAIGGVVNIITKKGQGPPRGVLHLEGGSYETFRERAGVQGAFGRFNFNVSASHYDTHGQFDNDDSQQTALAGRLGYDLPWKGELSLSWRYAKNNGDLPVHTTTPTTVFDPDSQSQSETWLFNLIYEQKVADWWDARARYGQWGNNLGFQDGPPPPPPSTTFADTPTSSQINTRRLEAELVNVFHPARWTTVSVGGEFRQEVGRNRHTLREVINTTGVFLQPEVRLFERLFITTSVRWEDNDVFGDEVTGRVAGAVVVKETGTKLRATWGTGFRAPTINDLFFPGFANADLKPERVESYDVGLDQRLGRDRIRFGATYFHNEFLDLIQIVFDPSVCPAGSPFGCPVNVGRARTQGVETYLELEPRDWLLLFVNYTRTSAVDKTTHEPLRRFAPHRWTTGFTLTPIDRLSLFAQAHVESSHFESPTAGRTPGWHRIDVGGTYRLWGRAGAMERLELTARVENLTDEQYDEVFGFRALGFNALVGLRAYFQ